MKQDITLDNPSEALVAGYIIKFEDDERYKHGDNAIVNLFEKFPNNRVLEDIILKVSVINELYSTSIYSVFKLAKHILECDIDAGLTIGNPETVHQIATGHGIRTKKYNTEINFYSFATKYCSWHKPNHYHIYDSFVEKVLIAYKDKDSFSKFDNKDLKDFTTFSQVLKDFSTFYKLTKFNSKELDKFLWIYGKEKFPPKYSKIENGTQDR